MVVVFGILVFAVTADQCKSRSHSIPSLTFFDCEPFLKRAVEIDALKTVVEKAKEQRIADIIIIDAPAGFDAGFERCALAADKGIIAATAP